MVTSICGSSSRGVTIMGEDAGAATRRGQQRCQPVVLEGSSDAPCDTKGLACCSLRPALAGHAGRHDTLTGAQAEITQRAVATRRGEAHGAQSGATGIEHKIVGQLPPAQHGAQRMLTGLPPWASTESSQTRTSGRAPRGRCWPPVTRRRVWVWVAGSVTGSSCAARRRVRAGIGAGQFHRTATRGSSAALRQ